MTPSLAADLVRVADEYDLLRHGMPPVDEAEAFTALRSRREDPQGERVFAALARALRSADYAPGDAVSP